MNTNIFKVIFSKRTGQLVVVSEITKGEGKVASAADGDQSSWAMRFVMKPLASMVMIMTGSLSILGVNNMAMAQNAAVPTPTTPSIIIADPNAVKTQQATILNTATGMAQVNIQKPTAAGVSINQYRQFDVNNGGAVLNNSRTDVNTNTAGWIQGNPWLGAGSAKVIVNQVNSANPSQLGGYIEVAGQKAEVVISNPSGINVSGGGFINASRVSLTTGVPIISMVNGGALEGYRVTNGMVNISGGGLDTQGANYTDILSRGATINAGIWANQLNVVTGINEIKTIDADSSMVSDLSHLASPQGQGTAPAFAIDTSALGGMYAGKISLIGTEKGLGVNNAGMIAADAGHVTVDVNGMIGNSGVISSNLTNNNVQLKSTALTNTGKISSQSNTQIQTTAIKNSGTITAGQELKIQAADIDNNIDGIGGQINAQRLDITANSLNNTKGRVQQTGDQSLGLSAGNIVNSNGGLIGYELVVPSGGAGTGGSPTPTTEPTGGAGTGTGTGTGAQAGTGTGTSIGGGSATVVQPAPVLLAAGVIDILNTLNNDAGQVTANGGIDLNAKNGLVNHGRMALNQLNVTGSQLDNSDGELSTTSLNASVDRINNDRGVLTGNTIDLAAQDLSNQSGKIQAVTTLTSNIQGAVLNQNGLIESNDLNRLNAGNINNDGGTIQSHQSDLHIHSASTLSNQGGALFGQTVTVQSGDLSNQKGSITSAGALALDAAQINNDQGKIASAQNVNIHANGAISNQSGVIGSDTQTTIAATQINNQLGVIQGIDNVSIRATGLDNQSGRILSADVALNTQGGGLQNQTGVIFASQHLKLDTGAINNNNGLIQADQSLDIQTHGEAISNNGSMSVVDAVTGDVIENKGIIAGQLKIDTGAISNQTGTISANDMTITSSGQIDNQDGLISTAARSKIDARQINNQKGSISSGSSLAVSSAQGIDNTGGLILGETLTDVVSGDSGAWGINNDQGTIASRTSDLTVNSQGSVINSNNGLMQAQGKAAINAASLDNQKGVVFADDVQLNTLFGTSHLQAGGVNNTAGLISGANHVNINSGTLINDQASIQTAGNLILNTNGQGLSNQAGAIESLGNARIDSGELQNQTGLISSGGDLDLNTQALNNQQGLISSQGKLTMTSNSASSAIDNQSGQIQSIGDAHITANSLNNQKGLISGFGSLTVNIKAIDNSQTKDANAANAANMGIQAVNVTLNSANINNSNGQIISDTDATIHNTDVINNDSGLISAVNNLKIDDPVAGNTRPNGSINNWVESYDHAAGNLDVSNESGQLLAGQNLKLDVYSLKGKGEVMADANVDIISKGGFHNQGQVFAGHNLNVTATGEQAMVTIGVATTGAATIGAATTPDIKGTIINDGLLSAGNSTTLNAGGIRNNQTGELSASQTTNINGSLANTGLVDGYTTLIKGDDVTNSGTGRIYGSVLGIQANTLSNLASYDANGQIDKSATIAARDRLDIGATTINNVDHSTLFSANTLNIGGSLDANNQATGRADTVNNLSATIESLGGMKLGARRLNNLNLHFSTTEAFYKTEHVKEYATGDNPSARLQGGVWDRHTANNDQEYADYITADGQKISAKTWYIFDYDKNIYRDRVLTSAPGQIISGGDMILSGDHWINDKSQIIAGQSLKSNELTKLESIAAIGNERIESDGTSQYSSISRKWYDWARRWRRSESSPTPYISTGSNPTTSTIYNTFELPVTQVLEHTKGQGSSTTIATQQTTTANAAVATTNASTLDDGKVQTGTATPLTTQTAQTTSAPNAGAASIPNMAGMVIRTSDINTDIPSSSLFTTHPDGSDPLIQTDPRFTNRNNWLSSDWMLNALNLDPNHMQKRLGDGYYEQKLIREQIAELTGHRYLDGYSNDDDQYKALMNSGLTYAQTFALRPGIALTPEQIARLTSDMVWLVEELVALPDGKQIKALVPKVYVVVRAGDVKGDGTLLSADAIDLKLKGDLTNSGTVAGRTVTKINADNINNLGGRIHGDMVNLKATTDINNVGGLIDANKAARLEAGRDVNFSTTTSTIQTPNGPRTTIDRVAALYVGDGVQDPSQLSLLIKSGRDTNLTAASIVNDGLGASKIDAGDDLNLNTVNIKDADRQYRDSRNGYSYQTSTDVGTQITTKGDQYYAVKDEFNATAAQLASDKSIIIDADTFNTDSGRDINQTHTESWTKEKGFLSTKTNRQVHDSLTDTAIGTAIKAGDHLQITTTNDMNIKNGDLFGGTDVRLESTKGDVNLVNDIDNSTTMDYDRTTKKGISGTGGGGLGFMIGAQTEKDQLSQTNQTVAKTEVGSMGNVTILAKNGTFTLTGSDIISVDGNVDILAKKGVIQAAYEQSTSNHQHSSKSVGTSVTLSNPVIDAIQKVKTTAEQTADAKDAGARTQTMSAANTAYAAYQLAKAADALKPGAASGQNQGNTNNQGNISPEVTVSTTFGSNQSKTQETTQATNVVGSTINAGGKVTITATGDGKASTIDVIGSQIGGEKGTSFNATGDQTFSSAQQTFSSTGTNSNSGWGVGVAATLGNGAPALGVTANANAGSGRANTTSVTQVNSVIGKGGLTEFNTDGKLTLQGAQGIGDKITANVKDLDIISVQDTSQSDSRQKNIGASGTYGFGGTASLNGGISKTDGDYAAVGQQSGLFSNGAFNVNVTGHTNLEGGGIYGTDPANSTFTTGTISETDIVNHNDVTATGVGVSTSFDPTKPGLGALSGFLPGFGHTAEHETSVTQSQIGTANITITNIEGQKALNPAGTSADRIIADLIANLTTTKTTPDALNNFGALANTYDKDKLQKIVDTQVAVMQGFKGTTKEIRAEVSQAMDDITQQQKQIAEQMKDPNLSDEKRLELLPMALDNQQKFEQLQKGNQLISAVSNALTAPVDGVVGIAAQTLSPVLASEIGQYFKDNAVKNAVDGGNRPETNSPTHIMAHAFLGAAVAAAGGTDVLLGAISAGGAEAVAPALAQTMFGRSVDQLTSDEKATISSITSLGATAIGSITSDMSSMIQSGQLASNAVENNWGEVGHYSTFATVLYLAGFSEKDAKAMALAAWSPDTDKRNAITVENLKDSDKSNGNQQWYHLLNGASPEVVRETQKRIGLEMQKIFAEIKENSNNPERKIAILTSPHTQRVFHAFGDAYAHVNSNGYYYSPFEGHAADSVTPSKDPDNPAYHAGQYQDYTVTLFNMATKATNTTTNRASIDWIASRVPGTSDENAQKNLLSSALNNGISNDWRNQLINSPIHDCGMLANCESYGTGSRANPFIRSVITSVPMPTNPIKTTARNPRSR